MFHTQLGEMIIAEQKEALYGVWFINQKHFAGPQDYWQESSQSALLNETKRQLLYYFDKKLDRFDLPLSPQGTVFQKKVWQQLQNINIGDKSTYGAIAESLGNPKGMRAVGAAVGKNPISLIIPCHRVLSSTNKLTGFAGGIERKKWLLDREGVDYKL